ncbi:MAG: glycosyltransferase family 39 protein [Anaerolineae bacterium]|nr:glycosyltransferase family 39 protein [Anaerolineae bacterium]
MLRLYPLVRYVTPDEPAWVYRSIRFADALAARDLAAVPLTGHPGVTTMWLGALGIGVRRLLDPAASTGHLEWLRRMAWLAPENAAAFRHLAYFLSPCRVAVALTTTAGLLAVYWLAARLLDRRTALALLALLALEPFLAGHSGLLHTDALLATFILLAILAAFNGQRDSRPFRYWALSGLFSGLALLTKTPAALLPPFLLGLLLVGGLRPPRPARFTAHIVQLAARFLVFAAALLAVFFALYPALWSSPLDALQTMGSFTGQHIEMAQRPIFFAGQMTYDPGPGFYPVVFLLRSSPLLLIGLALGLFCLRRLSPERRFSFLACLAFALLFGAAIALAAKRHDRYLLPALLPLALAAAIGYRHGAEHLRQKKASTGLRLLFYSPLLLQLLLALAFLPCPLAYANPLLGGPPVAARLISLDWGAGVGAAARWLNQQPGADQLTAAVADVPSFAALFAGRTVSLAEAPLADYRVLAAEPSAACCLCPQAQVLTNSLVLQQAAYLADHAAAQDLILLDAYTPLFRQYQGPGDMRLLSGVADEATLAARLREIVPGHEALWLVASAAASPVTAMHLQRQVRAVATPIYTATVPDATITRFVVGAPQPTAPAPFRASFAGRFILVDGAAPPTAAGLAVLPVTLRWQAVGVPATDYRAVVTLRDAAGRAWSTAEGLVLNDFTFPTAAWMADEWGDAACELALPAGMPPDRYAVEVSLYDAASGAGLGAAAPDGAFRGTRVPLGQVTVVPPAVPPALDGLDVARRADVAVDSLILLGWDPPPAQALSGSRLSIKLAWQATAPPAADYRLRFRLETPDGAVAWETQADLSPYPTHLWRAGDWYESRYDLHVHPGVPPGHYQLRLDVLGGADNAPLGIDWTVGAVEVLPRERSFDLPGDIPQPLQVAFGEMVHLRGYGLERQAAAPGEALALTLYWQAVGPAGRDYTLFVHLLGPDGLPHGQVDWIDYAAPSSSWAAGQVLTWQLTLPVAADAPVGVYHLAVGFYDAAYGRRLPAVDAAGRALPEDQAVLPAEIHVLEASP